MGFNGAANEFWLALPAAVSKHKFSSHHNRLFMPVLAKSFDFLFAFDYSKKKLIQQRSQQTSDRPSIPNILMMPISKVAEKSDQYAAE